MAIVMPLIAALIVLFGLIRGVPVFDSFMLGVRDGARTLKMIAPTILGLVFAVTLLKTSGAVDVICSAVKPVADALGFPSEIVPMALLRPVSGSGSSALLIQMYKDCGADSFAGRVASVIAGSSETTFYATAMYFGCVRVKRIRHTLVAALAADFTAMAVSVIAVRLYFGYNL